MKKLSKILKLLFVFVLVVFSLLFFRLNQSVSSDSLFDNTKYRPLLIKEGNNGGFIDTVMNTELIIIREVSNDILPGDRVLFKNLLFGEVLSRKDDNLIVTTVSKIKEDQLSFTLMTDEVIAEEVMSVDTYIVVAIVGLLLLMILVTSRA